MTDYLLDTSIVIKWFIEEEHTSLALGIQEKFIEGNISLAIPDLLLYELANALRYSHLFTKEAIDSYLQALLLIDLEVVPFDFEVLERAVGLSLERDLAIYDSYFVACAEKFNLIYLTADKKAYNKLKDLEFVSFLGEKA